MYMSVNLYGAKMYMILASKPAGLLLVTFLTNEYIAIPERKLHNTINSFNISSNELVKMLKISGMYAVNGL